MTLSYNTSEIIATFIARSLRWSIDTLRCVLGALNRLITLVAYKTGLLVREGKRHRINPDRIQAFLALDEIDCPFSWIAAQLQDNWISKGFDAIAKAVERCFHRLSEMGLWGNLESDYKRSRTETGWTVKRTPTKHSSFCMPLLLKAYEALEAEFIRRVGEKGLGDRPPATELDDLDFEQLIEYVENPPEDAVTETDAEYVQRKGFEALPRHKGALVPLIYEAVFNRKMNRVNDGFKPVSRFDLMADDWLKERFSWVRYSTP